MRCWQYNPISYLEHPEEREVDPERVLLIYLKLLYLVISITIIIVKLYLLKSKTDQMNASSSDYQGNSEN